AGTPAVQRGAPSESSRTSGASREKVDLTPSPRLCDKGPEGTGTAPATLVARDAVRAIRSYPEVRGASTDSRSDGRLGDGAAQARRRPRLPGARGAEALRVRRGRGRRILRRPRNPRTDGGGRRRLARGVLGRDRARAGLPHPLGRALAGHRHARRGPPRPHLEGLLSAGRRRVRPDAPRRHPDPPARGARIGVDRRRLEPAPRLAPGKAATAVPRRPDPGRPAP